MSCAESRSSLRRCTEASRAGDQDEVVEAERIWGVRVGSKAERGRRGMLEAGRVKREVRVVGKVGGGVVMSLVVIVSEVVVVMVGWRG